MEQTAEYKHWINCRNRHAYYSYFLLFLDGLETSAVTVVMLFYLEDSFHLNPDQTRMYFSIAEMFNAVGQMTGGLLIGRYIDRTRNLRLVVLINLWATIFGNLLYAMPFNVGCIIFGRFLCGLNESLQVALGGEFNRCYKGQDLIQVLGWNEICYSIGFNLGPGAPVLFTLVDFKLGWWRINKYNAVHILIVALSLFLYVLLWFKLSNPSKELEKMKTKHFAKQNKTTQLNNNKHLENDKDILTDASSTNPLMTWKQLLQVDIISVCLTYGIMRYSINTMMSLIAMYALSQFHWNIDSLSWLNVGASAGIYILIIILIKFKAFRGLHKSFFCYTSALNLTLFSFANLLLPYYITIRSYPTQMVYLLSHMLTKAWMYFQVQSAGKVLLFNTVTPENSCLIDGVRSTFGSMMRLFAFGTSFLCYRYPVYFLMPLGLVHFVTSCIILTRYTKHTNRKID